MDQLLTHQPIVTRSRSSESPTSPKPFRTPSSSPPRRRAALLLCLLLALSARAAGALERRIEKEVAPGVRLQQILRDGPKDPLVVTVLSVDLRQPGLRVEAPLASGRIADSTPLKGRATVSDLAARTGALAAINADFFPFTGDPLGVSIHQGELLSEPHPNRVAVGISREGKPFFGILRFQGRVRITAPDGRVVTLPVSGLNRARGANELILYSPAHGETTGTNRQGVEVVVEGVDRLVACGVMKGTVREVLTGGTRLSPGTVVLSGHGKAAAALREAAGNGAPVEIHLSLRTADTGGGDWCDALEAAGGGPYLIRNGTPYIDWLQQKMQSSFASQRHPRTALGVTRDDRLLLIAVDGRQPFSVGATLQELAALLLSLGAYQAINLDGGGSTALVVRDMLVNSPSGGAERPVANGLTVHLADAPPPPDPGELLSDPEEVTVTAGSTTDLRLTCADGSTEAAAAALWSKKGPGFVDQSGRFLGTLAGETTVTARLGSRTATFRVVTTAGEPVKLLVTPLPADPAAPDRVSLSVQARDAFGNPTPEREVTVTAQGSAGSRPPASVLLDAQGLAEVVIEWQPGETGRVVTLTCGKATSRWTPPRTAPTAPKPPSR